MSENTENKSLRDCYTDTTPFNQLDYIIERKIHEILNTTELVRVDSCTSSGAESSAGTVSATPIVTQIDGDGNAVTPVSIPRIPHCRLQGGIAAIVIDPVAGDIGVMSCCKRDSSTISSDTTTPQRPGSYRTYDEADGMLIGTVLGQAPTVYIELKQDNTITIRATGGITVTGDITVNGDVIADGISLKTHTHSGCQGGSTGTPS